MSQRIIVVSEDAVAISNMSGNIRRSLISPLCPFLLSFNARLARSHLLRVPSIEPDEKDTTYSECRRSNLVKIKTKIKYLLSVPSIEPGQDKDKDLTQSAVDRTW